MSKLTDVRDVPFDKLTRAQYIMLHMSDDLPTRAGAPFASVFIESRNDKYYEVYNNGWLVDSRAAVQTALIRDFDFGIKLPLLDDNDSEYVKFFERHGIKYAPADLFYECSSTEELDEWYGSYSTPYELRFVRNDEQAHSSNHNTMRHAPLSPHEYALECIMLAIAEYIGDKPHGITLDDKSDVIFDLHDCDGGLHIDANVNGELFHIEMEVKEVE
jgi:hypothetical protein